jgi:carbon storage regulator
LARQVQYENHPLEKVSRLTSGVQAMLVLTRKPQEKIHVGEDITITVVRVQGQSVRIGIDAPSHVSIRRGEIVARETERPTAQPRESAEDASRLVKRSLVAHAAH